MDGAYGAMAAVSPRLKPIFAGMERADSIAADPHKWLYVPYEAGATLVREPGRLAATFRKFPEYLASDPDSPFPGPAWFAERGVELSRGFKALKVWMGLKVHGAARLRERDRERRARWPGSSRTRWTGGRTSSGWPSRSSRSRTSASGRRGSTLTDADIDRLNRRIVNRLVGDGSFFLAPTILKGRTALRVCIVNFRTRGTT